MSARFPGLQRRALVNTSAYFALSHSRDHSGSAARAVSYRLRAERWQLYTTNFVLAETHALLLTRLNRVVAARVLWQIDQSATDIIRITVEDEQRARAIIAQYQDKDFSLTDATSFAVMERLAIQHAFTFDHDFTQYGWTVLAP